MWVVAINFFHVGSWIYGSAQRGHVHDVLLFSVASAGTLRNGSNASWGFLTQSQMLLKPVNPKHPQIVSLEDSSNLNPYTAEGFSSQCRGSLVPGLQSGCPEQCPHVFCVYKRERIHFKVAPSGSIAGRRFGQISDAELAHLPQLTDSPIGHGSSYEIWRCFCTCLAMQVRGFSGASLKHGRVRDGAVASLAVSAWLQSRREKGGAPCQSFRSRSLILNLDSRQKSSFGSWARLRSCVEQCCKCRCRGLACHPGVLPLSTSLACNDWPVPKEGRDACSLLHHPQACKHTRAIHVQKSKVAS